MTGHRGSVTTPSVIFNPAHHSCPQRIEVDIGGDSEKGPLITFNENAFVALFPQGSFTSFALVEPDAEALFQLFHENRQVAHLATEAIQNLPLPSRIGARGGTVEFLPESFHSVDPVKDRHSSENFLTTKVRRGGGAGHFEEEVKMIRHDTVSQDQASMKCLKLANESDKKLFFLVAQEKFPTHDAGETMVVGAFFDFDSRLTHHH